MSEVSVTVTRETAKALVVLAGVVVFTAAIFGAVASTAAWWRFPYNLIGELAAFAGWLGATVYLWVELKRRLGL